MADNLIDKFPKPDEFEKLGMAAKAFWYLAICAANLYLRFQGWRLQKEIDFQRWLNGLP